jgi:acyl-CoA-dependent ceramide synthase
LAKSQGISKRKDITRFSEQAWMSIYYALFWPLGLVRLRPVPLHLPAACNPPADGPSSTSTTSRRPSLT